jgi:hypothetical protein
MYHGLDGVVDRGYVFQPSDNCQLRTRMSHFRFGRHRVRSPVQVDPGQDKRRHTMDNVLGRLNTLYLRGSRRWMVPWSLVVQSDDRSLEVSLEGRLETNELGCHFALGLT